MAQMNWTELVVLGEDAETVIEGADRIAALAELHAEGMMDGHYLARTEEQDEDLDPAEWGPANSEIDWRGFVTLVSATPTAVHSRDGMRVYGTWDVRVGGVVHGVACVVGIPESDEGSAAASGAYSSYVSAWYADCDDYASLPRYARDEALSAIMDRATQIWRDEARDEAEAVAE